MATAVAKKTKRRVGLKAPRILWTAKTSNRKTGDVPTAYIGETKTKALRSCKGCNLLKNKDCYAWFGTVSWGFDGILSAYKKKPYKYSLAYALTNRNPKARMVRMAALGDPARANRKELLDSHKLATQLGLAFVGYTHFHREKGAWRYRKLLMASCDNIQEADNAVARGWRATAIVPYNTPTKRFVTPEGNHAVICPAQTNPGQITCNDCLLCDASRKTRFSIVAFKDHGPKVRNKVRKSKTLPTV